MLLLLLSIAAAPPVAVDVTGMEPQLAILRDEAAERGWRIGCEGRAGEEGVIRIHFSAETTQEAVDSLFGRQRRLGSAHRFYGVGDAVPERCDRAPAPAQGPQGDRVLAFGPREVMAASADIARACGFSRVVVRPGRDGDPPAGAHSLYPDWFALDAGEEIARRYGPSICFMQMQLRAVEVGAAEAE